MAVLVFASSSSPIAATSFISCHKLQSCSFLASARVCFTVSRHRSHFISLACSSDTSPSPPPEPSGSNDRVLKFLQNRNSFSSIVLVPRHLPNPVKQFSELPLADQAYYLLFSIAFMLTFVFIVSTLPSEDGKNSNRSNVVSLSHSSPQDRLPWNRDDAFYIHDSVNSLIFFSRSPNHSKNGNAMKVFFNRQQLFVGQLSKMCGALLSLLATTIPTLNAMKRAALSLEKLADAAREELPATMAAIRLSGMEISDLTLELSDLSQEISESVRSSARAVHAAEVGIRRMGSFAASQTLSMIQEHASVPVEAVKPVVATAAETTWQAVTQAQKVVLGLAALPGLSKWIQKKNMEEQQKIEEDTGSEVNIDPVAEESSDEPEEVSIEP